jgi:hypothetical protein
MERLGAVLALIAVAIIVAGATYSCTVTSQQYRAVADHCIDSGGSWVEASSGSYSGHCIATRDK